MKPATLSPEERKIVEIIWSHLERELKWPTLKRVMHTCAQAGLRFDPSALKEVFVTTHGSPQEVKLSFAAVLTLPQVRELLKPVPEVLRLGAQRFIEDPKFGGDQDKPQVTHEDFARLWPDSHQAALARILFEMSDWRFGSSSTSGPEPYRFSYYCSIHALRYEKVQTLDEALTADNRGPGIPRGQPPSGAHLQLLEAIYRHATTHGKWPIAIPFAVEHRDIGFIPDLAGDLKDPYLAEGFGHWDHSRLSLSIWALPLVDPTGETRARFVKAVKTLHRLWAQSLDEDRVSVTLSDLSRAMEVPRSEALEAALFIQSEHLWSGGTFNSDTAEWSISIDQRLIHYQDIQHWDDYLAIRTKLHGLPRALTPSEPRPSRGIAVRPVNKPEQPRRVARSPASPRESVFISYHKKDEKWLKRLEQHLKTLVKNRELKFWNVSHIPAGADWKAETEKALAHAKVAVLLVSPAFLASDSIDKHELQPLLSAARKEGLKILRVSVSTSLVESTEIAQYQPVLEKPLNKMHHAYVDDALVTVCEAIMKALE